MIGRFLHNNFSKLSIYNVLTKKIDNQKHYYLLFDTYLLQGSEYADYIKEVMQELKKHFKNYVFELGSVSYIYVPEKRHNCIHYYRKEASK